MAGAPQPAVGLRQWHPQSLTGAGWLPLLQEGTGLLIPTLISINPPPAHCSLCVSCSCSPGSLPWAEPLPWLSPCLWNGDPCSAELQPLAGAVCCHLEPRFPVSQGRIHPLRSPLSALPLLCLPSVQLHAGLCDPGCTRIQAFRTDVSFPRVFVQCLFLSSSGCDPAWVRVLESLGSFPQPCSCCAGGKGQGGKISQDFSTVRV